MKRTQKRDGKKSTHTQRRWMVKRKKENCFCTHKKKRRRKMRRRIYWYNAP